MCNQLKKPSSENPFFIAELDASVIALHPNQFCKGRTLVVATTHATELYLLEEAERGRFFEDMVRVAEALEKAFHPDKMNYSLYGNIVPHLHWHLIPRYKDDPYWGAPIDYKQRKELTDKEYARRIKMIQDNL